MIKYGLISSLLIAVTTSTFASGGETMSKTLDDLLAPYVEDKKFSGVLTFQCKSGNVQSHSFGLCDREKQIPCALQTKFRIGSISKNFTAAAILKLSELHKLKLDDLVSKWIPEYGAENLILHNQPVTIHHLLSHTSGVPVYETTMHAKENLWKKQVTTLEMIKEVGTLGLRFEPGQQFEYSNFGYNLLTLIIERASGQSFEIFLQELLFIAKLQSTGITLPDQSGLAKGYVFDSQISEWFSFYDFQDIFIDQNLVTFNGAGSMYSTAADLINWVDALRAEQIVSQESLDLMVKPNLNNFGYGWVRRPYGTTQIMWHNGALSPVGVYAELGFDVMSSFAYALLTNIDISSHDPQVLMLLERFIVERCDL